MFKRYIEKQIDKILTAHMETRRVDLPSGFYPLGQFKNGARQVVTFPWGAGTRTIVVQTLPAAMTAEIEKCAVVEIENAKNKKPASDDWINLCEKTVKAAMVNPTYEEMEEAICAELPTVAEGRAAFRRLEKIYTELAAKNKTTIEKIGSLIGQEKWDEFAELSQRYGCLCPGNFITALTFWEIGWGQTDAQSITVEQLAEAYSLAKMYGQTPHEIIGKSGRFLEGTEREIDIKAFQAHEKMKKKEPPKTRGKK